MKQYDLLVIGGGSGGLAVAEQAAAYQQKVGIIEQAQLGGTCVHRGCVPKKVMWHAANLAHDMQSISALAHVENNATVDWAALIKRRGDYIGQIDNYWNQYIESLNVDLIRGAAHFVDPYTVAVNGQHYRAKTYVIASGSQAIVPNLPGAELGVTSDGFFKFDRQPKRVAIIGGGYIAVELAGMLQALGSTVSVFALENRLLERFDKAISHTLETHMREAGMAIHLGFQVTELAQDENGLCVIGKDKVVNAGFDQVIWAVGRQANSHALNLQKAGVATDAQGVIPVNAYDQTNQSHIYAIGDVTGRAPLTPVAVKAGRLLARRLYDRLDDPNTLLMDYDQVPSVVFSHPPVATVGLTEEKARQTYPSQVRVYQTLFTPMKQHILGQNNQTLMKMVCVGTQERVVGLHLIGDQVDEMLQGFAVAVRMGATKADFDRTVAIHPSNAEELVTLKSQHCVVDELTEKSDSLRQVG